ncbi:c-type cytochrome [Hydrogenimonas cancrithermarum]|uniref:Cytochrome c domain-containing protein n=1 Tax=Hydrogenimonas cancrithermarum TaxID=2993563 RepID=A0ABN6WUM7_9BACT|nr:hypothetical protein [Hydrogenimonas cancrithermarum]BDY12434.1 hypothetical protein HCR_07460 [Hydrogenimonas cancrithermarum]
MHKFTMVALSAVLIAGLAGCGEKKSEESKSQSQRSAPQIKVTAGAVKKSDVQQESKENTGQFYYSYNKEKNASEEEKRRTTLDAYLNIRSPYERVQIEMMINKLSRDFIVKCSPCHDDYANGVIGPSLLDKDGDFIYKRLLAFKSGEKKNVLMKQLVDQLDDAKLKSIADEIAIFNKQIQEMRKGRQ